MKRVLLVALGLLLTAAIALGVAAGIPIFRRFLGFYAHVKQASVREPAALEEWKSEFGDPARTLVGFPSRDDSPSAVRLVELAHSVGIEMARPKTPGPAATRSESERALHRAISDYVDDELTKSGGPIASPPETTRSFIETHRPHLDDLIGFLLATNEPPVWKIDLSLGPEAPVPNLLGEIQLQRILVAYALDEAHLGHDGIAERALDASWNLNKSLRDRPEVISQLIAISAARMQVGLARRFSVEPAVWRSRFSERDYRASLLKAMEVEAVKGLHYLPTGSSPWERASRADFLDVQRVFLVGMRNSQVSDRPLDDLLQPDRFREPRSAGEILAPLGWANDLNALRRVDRLIIDSELTDRVLEARMLKARSGHWLADSPDGSASRMAGERWIYSSGGEGRLTISFSRELHWADQKGLILPLRYESN